MTKRELGSQRQVESELRQTGCPLCGKVADPDSEFTREDSRFPGALLHEKCLDDIAWKSVESGRSPKEADEGDRGGGWAERESD